jgi:hypothetical protein
MKRDVSLVRQAARSQAGDLVVSFSSAHAPLTAVGARHTKTVDVVRLTQSTRPGWGSVAGRAWIRRAILVTESLGAIRPCFQFQVDIGIRHFITCSAVANDQKGCILFGEVQEVT